MSKPKPSNIADVAQAIFIVSHQLVTYDKQHDMLFLPEEPNPTVLEEASQLILAIPPEQIHQAKRFVQLGFDQLPTKQAELKAKRLFYKLRPHAKSPLHAKLDAIEQATGQSIGDFIK